MAELDQSCSVWFSATHNRFPGLAILARYNMVVLKTLLKRSCPSFCSFPGFCRRINKKECLNGGLPLLTYERVWDSSGYKGKAGVLCVCVCVWERFQHTWRHPFSAAPSAAGPPSWPCPPLTGDASPPAPCAEPPGSSSSARDVAAAAWPGQGELVSMWWSTPLTFMHLAFGQLEDWALMSKNRFGILIIWLLISLEVSHISSVSPGNFAFA